MAALPLYSLCIVHLQHRKLDQRDSKVAGKKILRVNRAISSNEQHINATKVQINLRMIRKMIFSTRIKYYQV